MRPTHEPMPGDRTGVTTKLLESLHGPVVALAHSDDWQLIVFAGPVGPIAYTSLHWKDDVWLPWARCSTKSPERLARRLGLRLEELPECLTGGMPDV